jgi:steroid 5-alpha reductase family enzyme
MSFLDTFTFNFLIMLVIALVVSCIGFYKYVYFISLGYGFSIAAFGIAMLIMFMDNLSIGTIIGCVLFIIYGCRLGGYLLIREVKSATYRNTMKKEIKDGSTIKVGAKICIWTSCALLYALQVSPVFFRLQNGEETSVVCIVGVVIMACGILLESLADAQKSKAKAKNPTRFCDTGLYKIVRCPNYLGEVVFLTGVFVSSVDILNGVWQWLAAIIGYVCIVYIMFGGARRLEIRQNRNYGADPEYQAYTKKTPILIPLVPLYSVEKHKWLVG